MKKILLLFDNVSILKKHAHPERLVNGLQAVSDDVEFTYATFDQLVFHMSPRELSVKVMPSKLDIKDYDVIYIRRFVEDEAKAVAAAMYASKFGVKVVDSEIVTRKGSVSKLTQYMKMALAGLPIPNTYVTSSGQLAEAVLSNSLPIPYPLIMKIADATRGASNELIQSRDEALRFIADNKDGDILIQEFIDNEGDYRVWVLGYTKGPIFYRQRMPNQKSHKNNTSLGASLSLSNDKLINNELHKLAQKAARLFNREIAGVDIVRRQNTEDDLYIFEVNRAPQVELTEMEDNKALALSTYLKEVATSKQRLFADDNVSIGVSSFIDFTGYKNLKQIPARIDTGARTSALWASNVKVKGDHVTFSLFGPSSKYYTGKVVTKKLAGTRLVTSSTGHEQERYVVNMSIRIHGKRLNAKFTLSDRSTQSYPILIGRNTLRGNFLVDSGDPGEAMIYKYPEEVEEFNESEAV